MENLVLKPCPFCGEQPRLFYGPFNNEFFYKCDNVHTCETSVSTYIQEGPENAAIVWNNRADVKYWPCGVHKPEDGWEYLGSVSSLLVNKIHGLDVYRHKDPKVYAGISVQYGPNEEDYYSYEYVSSRVGADKSFEYLILTAYATRFDRITNL